MIRILEDLCTGCELCVKACPEGALEVKDKLAVYIEEKCTYCALCVPSCPHGALKMERKAVTADVSSYKGVWVFAEQYKGTLRNVVLELLGKGRELADTLGQELCVALLGPAGTADLAGVLGEYGADRIYLVESEALSEYSTDAFTDAMSLLLTRHRPNILLYGATHVGRDLAPSVASNLALGLTADCTALCIEEKDNLLLQTRPAFGGNVMADIVCPNTRPQMATVRPNVMPMPEPQKGRAAEVIVEDLPLDKKKVRIRVLEVMEAERVGAKAVEEADVVISGGRGVGEEGFAMMEELADLFGGAVGCSRPMVEKGVMPKAAQVGQSGKSISPHIYVAAGISGCVQHEVGIRASDHIIAINSDTKAAIFDLADFGIVGDVKEIVPRLIEAIKARKS
jgi:electron transfer flavoprotein alpha subunit